MKINKNRNKNRRVIIKNIQLSLLIGLCAFILISLTTTVTSWIFYFLREWGFITEKNFRIVWMFDFAIVCTILGSIISVIAVHRPVKKVTRLTEAMEEIANGNFTIRLKEKKLKINKITNKTVKMFNNMAQQLESTEMLSRDFINNFSHEFKTPIASINGFAKLLKDSALSPDEKAEYLDIIIQESERLSNLSINILSLSKLEQQSILTNKTDFNLTEQIRIIIGTLYQKWSAKNLDIVFEGNDVLIYANKEMLGQVWVNLLDNAIKFSSENSVINVYIDEKPEKITISLKNFSETIFPEQIDRIFDKFYQTDQSHSTNGNGLGLPMVKRIIELHNGTVKVRTENSEAVVFVIELPVR